jgi:hypothetical protein
MGKPEPTQANKTHELGLFDNPVEVVLCSAIALYSMTSLTDLSWKKEVRYNMTFLPLFFWVSSSTFWVSWVLKKLKDLRMKTQR